MKQKFFIGLVVIAAITLISGASILAVASPGTQSDPFITLSYLTNVFKPQVLGEASKTEQELTAKFYERLAELKAQLDAAHGSAQTKPDDADLFSVVTLNKGQSLKCSVGTEIMLRIGTASGFGSAPALVDYTNGEALSSGTALTTNYMYLITIEGNGVTATSATVKVLVRGNYTIS